MRVAKRRISWLNSCLCVAEHAAFHFPPDSAAMRCNRRRDAEHTPAPRITAEAFAALERYDAIMDASLMRAIARTDPDVLASLMA